jgi:hypothetical protein
LARTGSGSEELQAREAFKAHIEASAETWSALAYLAMSSQSTIGKADECISYAMSNLSAGVEVEGMTGRVDDLISQCAELSCFSVFEGATGVPSSMSFTSTSGVSV